MSDSKREKHEEQIKQIGKYYKKLKRITILIWLIFNLIVDIGAYLIWHNAHIEITIFVILVSTMLSTLFMIKRLNNLDKICHTQEMQLLEKTPLNRFKI